MQLFFNHAPASDNFKNQSIRLAPIINRCRKNWSNYYFNNLSLAEIAENQETSRNAIHKQIKDTENKLLMYEDKLKLCQKYNELREVIKDLDDDIKQQIEELI